MLQCASVEGKYNTLYHAIHSAIHPSALPLSISLKKPDYAVPMHLHSFSKCGVKGNMSKNIRGCQDLRKSMQGSLHQISGRVDGRMEGGRGEERGENC